MTTLGESTATDRVPALPQTPHSGSLPALLPPSAGGSIGLGLGSTRRMVQPDEISTPLSPPGRSGLPGSRIVGVSADRARRGGRPPQLARSPGPLRPPA